MRQTSCARSTTLSPSTGRTGGRMKAKAPLHAPAASTTRSARMRSPLASTAACGSTPPTVAPSRSRTPRCAQEASSAAVSASVRTPAAAAGGRPRALGGEAGLGARSASASSSSHAQPATRRALAGRLDEALAGRPDAQLAAALEARVEPGLLGQLRLPAGPSAIAAALKAPRPPAHSWGSVGERIPAAAQVAPRPGAAALEHGHPRSARRQLARDGARSPPLPPPRSPCLHLYPLRVSTPGRAAPATLFDPAARERPVHLRDLDEDGIVTLGYALDDASRSPRRSPPGARGRSSEESPEVGRGARRAAAPRRGVSYFKTAAPAAVALEAGRPGPAGAALLEALVLARASVSLPTRTGCRRCRARGSRAIPPPPPPQALAAPARARSSRSAAARTRSSRSRGSAAPAVTSRCSRSATRRRSRRPPRSPVCRG